MFSLRTTIRAASALIMLVLTLPTPAPLAAGVPDRRYELEIHNHSELDIYSIYMAPSYKTVWGRDLLEDDILSPRYHYTITDIIPGEYDFLFIDELERNCILRDIRIFENKTWEIDDRWLNRVCRN